MSKGYEEVSWGWARDIFGIRRSDVPPVVYHYTDAAGLMGMLRSGRVWATDYRFLNDRSEIEYTKQNVREMVTGRLAKPKDAPLTALYSQILASERNATHDAYVFSLSEDADDLSQWRGYARDGQGFTIGFCGRSIYEVSEPDDANFGFLKVEYQTERQIRPLEQALDDIERIFVESSVDKSEDEVGILADDGAKWFNWIVSNRAAANKHASFRGEREWRLVAKLPRDGSQGHPLVRTSGVRLVRYIELLLAKDDAGKLPIKSIGIGPAFPGIEERHALEALCRDTGYDVEIYAADTPFRRL